MVYREMTAAEAERILEIDATCYIENAWRLNSTTCTYELQKIDWTDRELPNGNDWHIRRFRETIAGGGKAFGCFRENGGLIGYATVNAELFGGHEKYVLLDQLFVSVPCRGRGIGRTLVELCKTQAKEFGAEKLFICAGSAENTIAFYNRLGAVPANRETHRILYLRCFLDFENPQSILSLHEEWLWDFFFFGSGL